MDATTTSHTASPDPPLAGLLAGDLRQSAAQRHGPGDGPPVPAIIDAIEADEDVRVVVFDSAVDGYLPQSLRLHGPARGPDVACRPAPRACRPGRTSWCA